MAAWNYADYSSLDGSARLARLRLHIAEVAQQITVEYSIAGRSKSAQSLEKYMETIKAEEKALGGQAVRAEGRSRMVGVRFAGLVLAAALFLPSMARGETEMGFLGSAWKAVAAWRGAPAQRSADERRGKRFGIDAAGQSGGLSGWSGSSDEFQNQEYVTALPAVTKRAQDLDVNNPDIRGHNRGRTAGCIGRGIAWKAAPRADEVGLTKEQVQTVAQRLNRVRELHSRMGGFDASGRGRSEMKLQETAFLTHFVLGSCLIHKVWNLEAGRLLPLALELIPGSRISTPYDKMGDPLVSWGIQYRDEHRSRVVGYWVQRVPKSIGNSFVKDYVWDFVPAADAALLALTEPAGLDRALPNCVATTRSLKNRGELVESAILGGRTHAHIYAVTEVAPNGSPYSLAADDRSASGEDAPPDGWVNFDGVKMWYTQSGEKVVFNNAHLPAPDFEAFMAVTDQRIARGLNTSLSRFTRKVDSSYSAGRQEEQMDDPVVEQLRENFYNAWQRVHEWFLDACYLSGAVELPGYSDATRCYWAEARREAPGKVHINPVDTANARRIGYALRTLTPQQACEEDGKDLRENLSQWGQAIQLVREMEQEHGLAPGQLDFLLDIPAREAAANTPAQRDGDGDGIVGEGRGGRAGGDATFGARKRAAGLNGKHA